MPPCVNTDSGVFITNKNAGEMPVFFFLAFYSFGLIYLHMYKQKGKIHEKIYVCFGFVWHGVVGGM